MSFLFIFYGLLFFTNSIEAYNNPAMHVFAGIFVSGGFLFTFGQFVPSWDSAYYPLMMSQNISYRQYLTSKWAVDGNWYLNSHCDCSFICILDGKPIC